MIDVRRLSAPDAPAIETLLERARQVPGGSWGLDWSAQHVSEECVRGGGWASTTESGELIAFVFLREAGDAQEILLLATDPKFRRQGRMTELLRHILTVGGEKSQLWLEVHAANGPAREFYEKLGFRKVGERKAYYSDGGAAILYNYN